MMRKTLVTYATKHGATQEIAAAIGRTLEDAGLTVDLLPVEQVRDLAPFEAVVLGSAVYAGRWRQEAVDFLERFADALAVRPVWIFSSGPTGEGDPVEQLNGWTFPEAQQLLAEQIAPREIVLFHGAIRPETLGLGERLIVKAVRAPIGDFREWERIETWAETIARELVAQPTDGE